MSTYTWGLVVGGFLPALFFGLSGVFAKPATAAGIGLGFYMMTIGTAIALTGLCIHLVRPDSSFTARAALFAVLVGAAWAVGTALVAVALTRYRMPLASLVPLYNLNTLVAVVIGLVAFGEWRELQTVKLLLGAILIAAGSTFVAQA